MALSRLFIINMEAKALSKCCISRRFYIFSGLVVVVGVYLYFFILPKKTRTHYTTGISVY